jgi:hypothetical protein
MSVKAIHLAAILATGFLISACDQLIAQKEQDYVAVIGSGSASALPDYATVKVVLSALKENSKFAVEDVTHQSNDLLTELEKFGVPAENILSTNFSVMIETEGAYKDGEYTREILGHRAAYTVEIKFSNFTKLGELTALLASMEVEMVQNPTYHVSDEVGLKTRSRALALRDAKQKANDFAKGTGRTLGKTLIVEESANKSYRLTPTLLREVADGLTGAGLERPTMTKTSEAIIGAPPLVPEPVKIETHIYVKHELL